MIALNYSAASQLNDSCSVLLSLLQFVSSPVSLHTGELPSAGFCDVSNEQTVTQLVDVGLLIVNDAAALT